MQGFQTKVLTSCVGHVQKFHCGLPRGLIHSVTLTLTGVYKSTGKVFKTAFLYNFEIELFDVSSTHPPPCMAVILDLSH